ncbi:MAG: hypothetical protein M3143_12640 [Actinomycetota bacterium]|nr:hypothetical protein [Actinomycetota bacterium]
MRVRYAAGVVAMAIIPMVACGEDETVRDPGVLNPPALAEQPQRERGQGGAAQESLEDRIGQQVQLPGEVAKIISPNAFTIGGDEIGQNPILVVGANMPPGLSEGQQVRVSGTVKEFQIRGYEEDLDLDLIDQEFEDFDGDPAIQANSVTRG